MKKIIFLFFGLLFFSSCEFKPDVSIFDFENTLVDNNNNHYWYNAYNTIYDKEAKTGTWSLTYNSIPDYSYLFQYPAWQSGNPEGLSLWVYHSDLTKTIKLVQLYTGRGDAINIIIEGTLLIAEIYKNYERKEISLSGIKEGWNKIAFSYNPDNSFNLLCNENEIKEKDIPGTWNKEPGTLTINLYDLGTLYGVKIDELILNIN
jgi:hypothetical protein